jgi:hypothetical protein
MYVYSLSHKFNNILAMLKLKRLFVFPVTAAWVQSRVRSCGICGGQSGTGVGFLEVLWFALWISIPPSAPHSLIINHMTL